jgi:hypothetical protein
MAGKQPYIPFFTGDWLKDPALSLCAPAARGVWIDLLCAMHEAGRSGELRGTYEQLARVARCSTADVIQSLTDLQATGAADVTERNGVVTVVNRRMKREAKERNGNRLRQRKRRGSRDCHAEVTPPYSYSDSTSRDPPYPLNGFSHAFQMAWDSWPARRRTKKQTAQSAWQDAIARLAFRFESDKTKAEDWLAERIRAYVRSPRAKGEFCQGIANWLTNGSYDDPEEAWQESGEEPPPTSMYQPIEPIQ